MIAVNRTIIAALTLALSGLIGSPASAGRGDFPHPPGGGVKCIQAPCPMPIPNPHYACKAKHVRPTALGCLPRWMR